MKKVKITVMRISRYADLMERYENPIEHACSMEEGMIFVANGWQKPKGFCESAWESLSPLRDDPGPRGRGHLRRLDEEPPLRHDLLQRRLPPGQLLHRSPGRGGGLMENERLTVNGVEYELLRLLGHGKGG